MNDILQQRLVGALILVALGIVFWPIVFLQPEDNIASQQKPTRLLPELSRAAVESASERGLTPSQDLAPLATSMGAGQPNQASGAAQPSRVDTPRPYQPAAQSSSVNAAEVAGGEAAQLAIDSDGIPVAWTLQVVTVSSEEKAQALRQQLLDMKQKAYIATVRSNGKKLYRVCIGPKFERAELEMLQTSINAQFKVDSMVARYIP